MEDLDDYWNGFDDEDRPGINYNRQVPSSAVSDEQDGLSDATVEYNVSGDADGLLSEPDPAPGMAFACHSSQPLNEDDSSTHSFQRLCSDLEPEFKKTEKRKTAASAKEENKRMKLQRAKEREENKKERLKQKELKAALANERRNCKPEEAMKRVTVLIDTQVVNSAAGAVVVSMLQKEQVGYRVEALAKPNTIVWTLADPTSGSQLRQDQLTMEIAIEVVTWGDVETRTSQGNLLSHVQAVQAATGCSKLSLVIFGPGKDGMSSQQRKGAKKPAKLAGRRDVSEDDVAMALAEIQVVADCCYRTAENGNQVAELVLQTARSVAKLTTHRQQAQDSDELPWYAQADGRKCVRVRPCGQGLRELWQQQLCQFNGVGLEVAQAVVEQYGSPQALLTAYRGAGAEAANLLQDIAVRRQAGILSSSRRVGPDLSQKVHRCLTSTDPSATISS